MEEQAIFTAEKSPVRLSKLADFQETRDERVGSCSQENSLSSQVRYWDTLKTGRQASLLSKIPTRTLCP